MAARACYSDDMLANHRHGSHNHPHPHPSAPAERPPASALTADAALLATMDHALDDLLRYDPVHSTRLGDHGHDGAFADPSPEGRAQQRHALSQQVHALEGQKALEPALERDRRLLLSELRVALRADEDLDPARRSPAWYAEEVLSGLGLLLRPPVLSRLGGILGRLRQVGPFLRAAESALDPEDVPRQSAELAISMARQGLLLITEQVPAAVHATVGDTPLAAAVQAAAAEAARHLASFANFVEAQVLPRAHGEIAAGDSLCTFLLLQRCGHRTTPETLLAQGWAEAERAEATLHDLVASAGLHGHPWRTALRSLEGETFLPDETNLAAVCADVLSELRRAAVGLVPLPARDESLIVEETPPCFRGLLPFAAYLPPALLSREVLLRGALWVTPGQRMTRHDLLLLCAHEGFPGHHLAACHLAAQPSRTRRALGGPMLTGWSLYVEDLLPELARDAALAQRSPKDALALALATARGRLWRALRVVLDAGLHCGGLTLDEAAELLTTRLGFTREQSLAEVRRVSLRPMEALTAFLGAQQIREARAAAQAQPDFSLLAFHRQVLMGELI